MISHGMSHGLAAARLAAAVDARGEIPLPGPEPPVFGAADFGEMSEMIGDAGVREMVEIFAAETRLRLGRLAAGDQNTATLVREMHTLKGASATVGSPRLAAMGQACELGARRGIAPTPRQLAAIQAVLEAFLREARNWHAAAAA